MIDFLSEGPEGAGAHLLFAHGAGAPMTSPFMDLVAAMLAAEGLRVTRFEFGYMAKRRSTGKRTPPPKAERLVEEYVAAVEQLRTTSPADQRLVIGGKSMGGRVASLAAQTLHDRGRIQGLVCLGYPFHPPAKPEQLRTAHLATLNVPALIIQGTRDPFGQRHEVEEMRGQNLIAPSIEFWWAADGDHDLGPRGNSGFTRKGNLEAATKTVASFCEKLVSGDGRAHGRATR